jgi:hypothetical protein
VAAPAWLMLGRACRAQVGYGACIVSFLGAVHWGMAMGSGLSGPIAAKIAQASARAHITVLSP